MICGNSNNDKEIIVKYAIAMTQRDKKKIIYVSSIEDICVKIYRELKEKFDDMELMLNQKTINRNTSCIIMSMEILRSLLFKKNKILENISYVIFNELEYIRHKELGVTLEENIILLSIYNIHYFFLSEEIPNAREFGIWITTLQNQPCNIVYISPKSII